MKPYDKPISVKENLSYQPWEMPDLTGVKRSIAKRLEELENQPAEEDLTETEETLIEEPEVFLPTEEEIEALIAAAEAEGYNDGFANGQAEGFIQGKEEGLAAGTSQGKEEGYAAGLAQGMAEAQVQVTAKANRLANIINSLLNPLAQQTPEIEQGLISLVDQICRQVLRREIKLDSSHLQEVLEQSLAALPEGAKRLRVYCHPDDLELLQATPNLPKEIQLLKKNSLTLGSLEVESLQSLVDATLETRYKKILNQLLDVAYADSGNKVTPLPEEVLATPASQPLEEVLQNSQVTSEAEPELASQEDISPNKETTEKTEIKPDKAEEESLTVSEVNPAQPAVSQGLQKSRAPRNLPPLTPINEQPRLEEQAETLAESQPEVLADADSEAEAESPKQETTEKIAEQEVATDDVSAEAGVVLEEELSAKEALLAANKLHQLKEAQEAKQPVKDKEDESENSLADEPPEEALQQPQEAPQQPQEASSIHAESYLGN